MAKFTVINTFNSVKFDDNCKPLVICDIDHTFIRCYHDIEYFHKITSNDKSLFYGSDYKNSNNYQEANNLMNASYNIGFVKQTDPVGFSEMLKKIETLHGKLIFLTARSNKFHYKTIDDLLQAGLRSPEGYEIHYTGNDISKGEYIKQQNLTDGYDHVSFIDDYPIFIDSVIKFCPEIKCYLFYYD